MIDLTEFKERSNTIRSFIYSIESLEKLTLEKGTNNPYINYLRDHIETKNFPLEQLIIVQKSNTLLMMYNLVESTIRTCVAEIFDSITSEKVLYQDLVSSYQKLWFDQQFKTNKGGWTPNENHRKIANDVITDIIQKTVSIQFNLHKFKLSGNIDSNLLKEFSESFSVYPLKTLEDDSVKTSINLVKNLRNSLAHGSVSFRVATRNMTVNEISNYYEDVNKLLIEVIKKSNRIMSQRKYIAK